MARQPARSVDTAQNTKALVREAGIAQPKYQLGLRSLKLIA